MDTSDHDDAIDRRLATASGRLSELGSALLAGGPWALAERFDHSPEASWGPRETLAHLQEMLPFWLGEAERLIEAAGAPVTIGRAATDDVRLAIIERDRSLPMRELLARVQNGIDRWRRRWSELDDAERGREGTHVTLGVLTVTDMAARFSVGHLEDHLDQLAGIIGGEPARD
jgi:hypothetical protein